MEQMQAALGRCGEMSAEALLIKILKNIINMNFYSAEQKRQLMLNAIELCNCLSVTQRAGYKKLVQSDFINLNLEEFNKSFDRQLKECIKQAQDNYARNFLKAFQGVEKKDSLNVLALVFKAIGEVNSPVLLDFTAQKLAEREKSGFEQVFSNELKPRTQE